MGGAPHAKSSRIVPVIERAMLLVHLRRKPGKVAGEKRVVDVGVERATGLPFDDEPARRAAAPAQEDDLAEFLAGDVAGTPVKLKK
ncbi:MAG: hypothetical protein BRD48_01415 [Bacteroidetes bacterium QS_9_68_14]|nr:MAG: hypothetical protein BRD48_01415 [Bacteroidetes bacterium QS_9_68_14]